MWGAVRNRPLRLQINPDHIVIAGSNQDYYLLEDDEIVLPTDETSRVSGLLSLAGDKWVAVSDVDFENSDDPENINDSLLMAGKTVEWLTGPESPDCDSPERIFRRRIEAQGT